MSDMMQILCEIELLALENGRLRAERDGLRAKVTILEKRETNILNSYREIEYKNRQLMERVNAIDAIKTGEYWAWMPGEDNHIETLTCPVLIPAEWLRNLIDEGRYELKAAMDVVVRQFGLSEQARDDLRAKLAKAEARVEGLEAQLTEALEESTKLQNEAMLLAMDYERAQNALDTLRHVLEDAATRVKVLQAVADVARQVVSN